MSLSLSSTTTSNSLYKQQGDAGIKATLPTATMGASTVAGDKTTTNDGNSNSNNTAPTELDFIASDVAVKQLFSLPYAASGQSISVAVHNLDGTLLLDNDIDDAAVMDFTSRSSSSSSTSSQPNVTDFMTAGTNTAPGTTLHSQSSPSTHHLAPPAPAHETNKPTDREVVQQDDSKTNQEERSLVPISTITES